METFLLPIPIISWVFTLAGLGALLMGASLLTLMYKADKLPGRNADYTVWNDIILLGVWGIAFIAGMGMMNDKAWAPVLTEYFCWVMIVLTIVNSITRIRITRAKFAMDRTAGPFRWPPVIIGAAVVIVPVVGFCAATIFTLHDDNVQRDLKNATAAAEAMKRNP